jgi:hypothetical protein
MARFGVGRTVGYRRLRAPVDHGLLMRTRLVYGQRALYVATREGLAWVGLSQVEPARMNVSTARHWAVCARLAVILGARRAVGRAVIRAAERDADQSIASAPRGNLLGGRLRSCRPDLVPFPPDPALPVAVEVELSVKGARRLEAMCRAWARCRLVSEVGYDAACRACRFPCRPVVHGDDAIQMSLVGVRQGAL